MTLLPPYRPRLPRPAVRLGFLFLLLLTARGCGGRPKPAGPNILFISVDTLRADLLGCYGNKGDHTPHMDALARKGMLFLNCTAPMATTFPSHTSMFTGLYPRFHGVRWNGDRLGEQFATVAEVLERAGYDTAAFVAYQAMLDRGGLARGFQATSPPLVKAKEKSHGIRSGRSVNALAEAWLARRNKDRPFFLWVHYYEPHGPYPVTPFAGKVMEAEHYSGPFADGAEFEEIKGQGVLDDPANLRALRALYAGRVREADACVGEILRFLEAHGLEGRTAVILLGDHGQLLGEERAGRLRFGHGPTLWEPALRVPLLVRIPGIRGGRCVEQRVGVVDLAPTVLELAGAAPAGAIQGRSLLRAIRGRPIEPRLYLAEMRPTKAKEGRPRIKDRVAVYDGRLKLVYPGNRLYDLAAPEGEQRPVETGFDPDRKARLEKAAKAFYAHRPAQSGAKLSREDLEELEALGYIK